MTGGDTGGDRRGSGLSEPQGSPAPPLLLRAAGAAELCGTTVRTWRTWGTMGKIPRPVYVGRIPFWRYDELRAWADAGCPDLATWKAMRD